MMALTPEVNGIVPEVNGIVSAASESAVKRPGRIATFVSWVKRGLSDDQGNMDDARINAGMLVLSYIGMGLYAIHKMQSADMAAFVQAWAIGGAALAGGIGAWFGIRGKN